MPGDRRNAWPGWVAHRDAQIRARLVRGSEDSIVNLLFFGTRFTSAPRIRSADIASLETPSPLMERRLDDLIAAIRMPGTNGRLRFVRTMIERQRIDPESGSGRLAARRYVVGLVQRFVGDRARYARSLQDAKRIDDPSTQLFSQSTVYRDRGLSSDTSIFPNFAPERALSAISAQHVIAPASVRRIGVVGPGLDFADKDEGFDFYPQQTIQPFAVIDSVARLGLGSIAAISTTTFDLNPRVTEHLQAARDRARAGDPYVVQSPRSDDEHWRPELLEYWRRFGSAAGQETAPVAVPATISDVTVRGVSFAAPVVLSISPIDLDIVLQRLEPARDDGYDLIVATNILVYYDVFEQALALSNIGRMLRPGGIFLTNTTVLSSQTMPMIGYSDTPYTDSGDGDRIWWYQRR
jgi:hypothetical protein